MLATRESGEKAPSLAILVAKMRTIPNTAMAN
jgi:hypothetical protein